MKSTKAALSLLCISLLAAACGDDDSSGRDVDELDFSAAALETDQGMAGTARPSGISAMGGKLFVALGNLTADCFSPAGPGYVAVVDLADDGAMDSSYRLVRLPDGCRNPQQVVADEIRGRVLVSCAGEYGYGAAPSESIAILDGASEEVLHVATIGCGDGDESCRPATPGRMTVLNDGRVIVGAASEGRVYGLDPETGKGDAEGVSICGASATGYQMIGDVVSMGRSVYATCFNTSEIVLLDDALSVYASQTIGSGAQALALVGYSELLVADGMDSALYAFDVTEGTPKPIDGADRIGQAANQVLVDGETAYVINSTDNAIEVIDLGKERQRGITTSRVAGQIPTATSTSPDATGTSPYMGAIQGDSIYVTLMGACSADGAQAGSRIVRIPVK